MAVIVLYPSLIVIMVSVYTCTDIATHVKYIKMYVYT